MSKKNIFLSQRKYTLDLLSEAEMLGCRSTDSPMGMNTKMLPDQGKLLENVERYRRLVKKLNIRHHICGKFSVSIEDYSFGGGNENFEVPKKSSRESASLFKSWTYLSSRLVRCRLGRVSF